MPDYSKDPINKQLDYLAIQLSQVEEMMIDPREFGRLEGAVTAMRSELDSVKERQVLIDSKIDQVLAQLSEARGGWRLLMALGGAGATLGSLITWFITNAAHGPK